MSPSSSAQPHFSLRCINCTLAKENALQDCWVWSKSGGNRRNVEHERECWRDGNPCGRPQPGIVSLLLQLDSYIISMLLKHIGKIGTIYECDRFIFDKLS